MGYRGRRGRYPGNGPFRNLPPWGRPGWVYGYGVGRGSLGDQSKCVRFPWLPRWWWVNPDPAGGYPELPAASTEDQRKFLEDNMKLLEQELSEVKKRLEDLGSQKTTGQP